MASGEFINLLRSPDQPMLVVGSDLPLRELSANTKHVRKKKKKKPEARSPKSPDREDKAGSG